MTSKHRYLVTLALFLGLAAISESKSWGNPYNKLKSTTSSSSNKASSSNSENDHTILGIDLGGKWIKSAVFQGKDVTVIEDDDNARRELSIVSFLTNEHTKSISFERLFGRPAQRQLYKAPPRTFLYATELLGRPYAAFPRPDAFHPYDVVAATLNTSRAGVRASLAPGLNVLGAEEVVAMLLRHVKEVAEASPRVAPNTRLSDCVLAVHSAVATAQERAALVDAARIAGLNVVAIVSGTTASAIAYAKDKPVPVGRPYRMAIVDMGATALETGIFDISEVSKESPAGSTHSEGAVKPLGSACDGTLGGRVFVARLTDLILAKAGLAAAAPQTLYYRAYAAAEKVMEVLSVNTEAFYTLALPERDYSGQITRSEFEEAAKDLLARVPEALDDALTAAGVKPDDIDDVQIVGGATRIPAVQAAIVATLGKKDLHTHISADEGACIGAAYLGAHISPVARMYIRRKVAVRDVTTIPVLMTFGADKHDNQQVIFPVGTVVGSKRTVTLPITLNNDDGNTLSFTLTHPKSEDATRCTEIARFSVVLPPLPPQNASLETAATETTAAATLKVVVTLGLTGIPAVEKASVVYNSEDLPPVDVVVAKEPLCIAPLSQAEFASAVQHLALLDTADKEKRELHKARNDLEEYLLRVQRFLSDSPRASKFAKPEELAALQSAVSDAEEWFESCPDEGSALDPVPKSDFEDKLKAVRALGDAILLRESEAEARPHAVALLKHALRLARADLAAMPARAAEVKTIVDQFVKRCDLVETWMKGVLEKQAALSLDEPPAFLTEEVDEKLEILHTTMIFAGYNDYSSGSSNYGSGSSEKKMSSTGPSIWTDVVTLDDIDSSSSSSTPQEKDEKSEL